MEQLGGCVEVGYYVEYGCVFVVFVEGYICDGIFVGLFGIGCEEVWMSYGDWVISFVLGFEVIGVLFNVFFVMIVDELCKFFVVQFYFEVYYILNGCIMLENFVCMVGFIGDWIMVSYCDEVVCKICEQVGDCKVICGLLGGVDSLVVVVLIYEVIGDQLICVFVDYGLLWLNEVDEVVIMFCDNYNIFLIYVDEVDLFIGVLEGVSDFEVKCKIIGKLFIDVFQKYVNGIEGVEFLVQGMFYFDVIELVSFSGGFLVIIKLYYNVGGLFEKMGLKLVEFLCEFFKDEVWVFGCEFGLFVKFIGCYFFFGFGFVICCFGEIIGEKLEILCKVDVVFIDQICKYGFYDDIWQVFVVIFFVCIVGVMGDGCIYDYVCVLWVVISVDGMMVDYYFFLYEFLGEMVMWIINEVKGINCCIYDIILKLLGMIEWE